MRQSPLGGFDSMPQIVLPALLSATVSTASVGFVGFGSSFLVNAALGAAMYALAPQPKAAGQSAQTFAVKSSNETRKIVYGEARVGGVLTFAESSNDETYLHLVVTFAAHEVNSFKTFYIDGEAITLSGNDVTAPAKYVGKIKVYPVNVGLVANTPAALISDTSWTSAHVLNGQAYTYFRFTGGDGTFTGGVPNISVVLEGKKVYDPRDTLTAYSANPALCTRDYLTDATFGLGAASSEINDTSFIAAANTADEACDIRCRRNGTPLYLEWDCGHRINATRKHSRDADGFKWHPVLLKRPMVNPGGGIYHSDGHTDRGRFCWAYQYFNGSFCP
jgi:hypothetical protein